MNAVRSYFRRNWKREDLMNFDEIPVDVHRILKKVYLTLFCVTLSATFGSFLHLISVAGGQFTVLSYVASLIFLYFTPPCRVKRRVLLSMLSAYSFGASLGIFTKYLFEIKQYFVIRFLAGTTIEFAIFLGGAMVARERSKIYHACLIFWSVLMFSSFAYNSLEGRQATHWWMIKLHAVQSLFMGYLVLYSQEILYNANFGDINFAKCTFTVFFHLPAIVIHAARLYMSGWRN